MLRSCPERKRRRWDRRLGRPGRVLRAVPFVRRILEARTAPMEEYRERW